MNGHEEAYDYKKGVFMSRPSFVRTLSAREQHMLNEWVRRNDDVRAVRRAQMIRLSSQGQTTTQIAEQWNVHPLTVLRTIQAFNTEGIESLRDKPHPGRPPKAQPAYVQRLKDLVGISPRTLGYPFSSWTLPRLREHLTKETGILLHPCYLSRIMAQHRIVYRRPRHVMSHLRDPKDYREKQAILTFLKKVPPKAPRTSTCCSSTNVRFTCTRP